jgi:hypothetical protein
MPARSNRAGRTNGRVTPKGTRPTAATDASASRSGGTAHHRPSFGSVPDRGVRPSGFRPPPPRSGTRGNR